MENKKMTKKDWYGVLMAMEEVKANAGAMEFIQHEVELLERKNSADRKPTATQIANEGIKETILSVMEKNNIYTITQILKLVQPKHSDIELTNHRISALVRGLMNDNKVVRIEDKRKAFFQIV